MEACAVALVLLGLGLFSTSRLTVVAGLCIAGGAYVLLLPHLEAPESGAIS